MNQNQEQKEQQKDDLSGDSEQFLCISLNQFQDIVTIGTNKGFKAYQIEPKAQSLDLVVDRDFGNGIGICQVYYRSNLFALVGGGLSPNFPLNRVMIWDEADATYICELIVRDKVHGVKMNKTHLFVLLENSILLFLLDDYSLEKQYETCPNKNGIFCFNPQVLNQTQLFCFPDQTVGQFSIIHEANDPIIVQAYQTPLSCIKVNNQLTRIVVGSHQDQTIKLYDPKSGKLIQEIWRGQGISEIYSFSFSDDGLYFGSTSDSGKIKLFVIQLTHEESAEFKKKQIESKYSNQKNSTLTNILSAPLKLIKKDMDLPWYFSTHQIKQEIQLIIQLLPTQEDSFLTIGYGKRFHFGQYTDQQDKHKCSIVKQGILN